MHAYANGRRGWSNAAVRRALLLSYWTLGSMMILFALGLLGALLKTMQPWAF
jgi:hypothetical protein